jgi:hypothetical protein
MKYDTQKLREVRVLLRRMHAVSSSPKNNHAVLLPAALERDSKENSGSERAECGANSIINDARNQNDRAQQEQIDRYERQQQETDAATERAKCVRNGIINEVRNQLE